MSHPHLLRTLLLASVAMAFSPPALANNSLGAGVIDAPRFPGSSETRIDMVPLVDVEGERFFARTTRGAPEFGAALIKSAGFELGVIGSIDRGRTSSDSAILASQGVADIEPFGAAGLVASYTSRLGVLPYEVLLRPLHRLGDSDGWTVDTRASVGIARVGRFSAAAHAQITWADSDAHAVDFDLPRASPSGGYIARGGVRERRVGISSVYQLTARTRLVAQWERRRLATGLLASPIVEVQSTSAVTVGVAFAL